jgi:hypothetical protein
MDYHRLGGGRTSRAYLPCKHFIAYMVQPRRVLPNKKIAPERRSSSGLYIKETFCVLD